MSERKNLKLNEATYERLRDEKGEYETWDGALNRMLDELDDD
jgi:phage-related minor tail protein